MKRCWIGAGMLAVLLVLSLCAAWAMTAIHTPVETALAAAENAVLSGDWDQARLFSSQAREDWETWSILRLCLADHTPVEEVASQFALLESRGQWEDPEEFAALAAQTREMVRAIGEAHCLRLETFF